MQTHAKPFTFDEEIEEYSSVAPTSAAAAAAAVTTTIAVVDKNDQAKQCLKNFMEEVEDLSFRLINEIEFSHFVRSTDSSFYGRATRIYMAMIKDMNDSIENISDPRRLKSKYERSISFQYASVVYNYMFNALDSMKSLMKEKFQSLANVSKRDQLVTMLNNYVKDMTDKLLNLYDDIDATPIDIMDYAQLKDDNGMFFDGFPSVLCYQKSDFSIVLSPSRNISSTSVVLRQIGFNVARKLSFADNEDDQLEQDENTSDENSISSLLAEGTDSSYDEAVMAARMEL